MPKGIKGFGKGYTPWNKGQKTHSIKRTCQKCGKEFLAWVSNIKLGKAKFCSLKCKFINRQLGKIVACPCGEKRWESPSRFRKGKGKYCSQTCSNRYNVKQEEQYYQWKGDDVGYAGLHDWVEKHLGKPRTCEHCGKTELMGNQIHWANKSQLYKRDLMDWLRLCAKCHKMYDHNLITIN